MKTKKMEGFELNRASLLSLAYRMLGDFGRAEDVLQEAWLKWDASTTEVEDSKGFLVTAVTRLCLDELGSARARKEESRGDRLPEPVDLLATGLERVEALDRISMAFLVLLQKLTPAERAVFLLHEVFELDHEAIGAQLGKSTAASRQLLKRARGHVAQTRDALPKTPPDSAEHFRLLEAFVRAMTGDEVQPLYDLLAEDAVLIADAGPGGGRHGKIRNVGKPVQGRVKIAALVQAISRQQPAGETKLTPRLLNGQPAIVGTVDGEVQVAIFLSVNEGSIHSVFIQADPRRLGHLGRPA